MIRAFPFLWRPACLPDLAASGPPLRRRTVKRLPPPSGLFTDVPRVLAITDTDPFVYIDQLAIQPTARRTRLGSKLYDALESAARIEAISALCCEVNLDPPNPGSMAFHQRSGFSITGELHTADGRTVALLIKPLK